MVTDTQPMSLWDDELEELASQAIAVHGEETVLEATDRTIHQFVTNGTRPFSASGIKMALKAALRRLSKPH